MSRPLLGYLSQMVRVCSAALAALSISLVAIPAGAQDYPTRPIRIIVPYSAGGSSDAPMRVIAQELSKQLGQQIIIDNKPGMGAMVGSEMVARAAPDGYTLLLASNPQVISVSLYPKLSFDPVDDFVPITLLGRESSVLVVHPSFPAKTIKEFIAYVKQRPQQIDYASSGNGSAQHLFTATFLSLAGLKMVHIPYRGSAQATADLLAGQVKVAMPGLAAMANNIKAGRLRALAVTGTGRSPLLPDVPTLDESGFPGYSAYVWMGLMAPRGTPAAIIEKLHRESLVALKAPAVKSFMSSAAIDAIGSTPAEFGTFIRAEKERAAKAVKEAGVHLD